MAMSTQTFSRYVQSLGTDAQERSNRLTGHIICRDEQVQSGLGEVAVISQRNTHHMSLGALC